MKHLGGVSVPSGTRSPGSARSCARVPLLPHASRPASRAARRASAGAGGFGEDVENGICTRSLPPELPPATSPRMKGEIHRETIAVLDEPFPQGQDTARAGRHRGGIARCLLVRLAIAESAFHETLPPSTFCQPDATESWQLTNDESKSAFVSATKNASTGLWSASPCSWPPP